MDKKPQADDFLENLYLRAATLALNWGATSRNTDDLRRHIEGADIVIGIVMDASEPRGFGVPLIKGANLIRNCIADGLPQVEGNMAAVPCRDYEEAEAMRQVFGDGAGGGVH